MELEFHIFKSISSISGNTMISFALGGGFDGIRGKNAQQWYAYANTSVCILGKSSGDGNSFKLGLLNVFRCNNLSSPADGRCGNTLFPKFLQTIIKLFLTKSFKHCFLLTNPQCAILRGKRLDECKIFDYSLNLYKIEETNKNIY